MPIELSDLLGNECWVDVEVAGGTFRVAYKPETTSLMRQAEMQRQIRDLQARTDLDEVQQVTEIAKVLCEVVVNWDITVGGQPLPITPDVVAKTIPGPWVNIIIAAIREDRDQSLEEKKRLSATSGAGLPTVAPSGNAPNGIRTSVPRDTWA